MEHITEATEKENLLFKQQKEMRAVNLSHEQINFIIQQLNYGIKHNEDIIKNSKDKDEREVWKDENIFIKTLINDLKQDESQLVIQKVMKNELTAEQEDYILESYLEQVREARNGN